ncbi:MAG TPA: hypothetical protein VKC89_00500 [Patescibacteria group bacterium]|nr:hypothetical protein [Patescibacteria group bacterium]
MARAEAPRHELSPLVQSALDALKQKIENFQDGPRVQPGKPSLLGVSVNNGSRYDWPSYVAGPKKKIAIHGQLLGELFVGQTIDLGLDRTLGFTTLNRRGLVSQSVRVHYSPRKDIALVQRSVWKSGEIASHIYEVASFRNFS